MMNQIHHRVGGIHSMNVDGLSRAQLRHYARRAGLRYVAIRDGIPTLVGTIEQRDALLCELESAGFIIEKDYR